mmetsp:Transcript_23878/g.43002  ORF Transcript_23878/g.43002 Transcript_23878/m.43002 type:complete len:191 (-) Transcript_23878:1082-1654(-)
MRLPIIESGEGWTGYESGEICEEDVQGELCCRLSQEDKFFCAHCTKKLRAHMLNWRGGGCCHLETLSSNLMEKYGIKIEHAHYGAYHRHYCKSCPQTVSGKDHISLDTDRELFNHLKYRHDMHVEYFFKVVQREDYRGARRQVILSYCAWKHEVAKTGRFFYLMNGYISPEEELKMSNFYVLPVKDGKET